MRTLPGTAFVVCLGVFVAACGSGDISLTEYSDRLNEAVAEAERQAEALFSKEDEAVDFTPHLMARSLLRGLNELRIPLQESVDKIEPPDQIADLHHRMWDWHRSFIAVETALADRAALAEDTGAGWTALSDSEEMRAYRAAIATGKELCISLQDELDATADRDAFADEPWLPAEMKEVVDVALGCRWFPDDPSTVYLYPAPDMAP